jgi:hypothetical protein
MIELSSEWLTEVARQASDDDEAWCAARPAWLALDEEPSAVRGEKMDVDVPSLDARIAGIRMDHPVLIRLAPKATS